MLPLRVGAKLLVNANYVRSVRHEPIVSGILDKVRLVILHQIQLMQKRVRILKTSVTWRLVRLRPHTIIENKSLLIETRGVELKF